MILPSINASNCGDPVRDSETILSGNEIATRKTSEYSAIRNQGASKGVQGSTTKRSSLNPKGTAKLSRMGRFVFLAWFLVWSPAFLPSVVKADMGLNGQESEILNPVISFVSVNVVNDLSGSENSSKVFFHNNAVDPHVSFPITERMIGHADHLVSVVCGDVSGVKGIGDSDSVFASESTYMVCVTTENLSYRSGTHARFGHLTKNVSGNSDSLNPFDAVSFHVFENKGFVNSIFASNLPGGSKTFVFLPQLFWSDKKLSLILWHVNSISPKNRISQAKQTRYGLNLLERARRKDKEPSDNIMEIKALGDRITIDTIPTIVISKYTKGMNLNDWQDVDSPKIDMYINRATVFKFKMDKIDLAQFLNKDKMNQCAKDAAEQQAIYIDTEALSELYAYAAAANCGAAAGRKSGLYNVGATGSPIPLTESNILRYILMCQAIGDEQNWPRDNRWLVLPTWATFLLNNSDSKMSPTC